MRQYYLLTDGFEDGPFDEETLKATYEQGAYPSSALVWTEGMSSWMPIDRVFIQPSVASPLPSDSYDKYNSYNNPFSALCHMYSHASDFDGRATRKEYWMSMLGVALILIPVVLVLGAVVLLVLGAIGKAIGSRAIYPILPLAWFGVLRPVISLHYRRIHDVGKSAWFLLLAFWLLGPIGLIIVGCLDSRPGTNSYGPSEKYPG